jgi:hypothetical protein
VFALETFLRVLPYTRNVFGFGDDHCSAGAQATKQGWHFGQQYPEGDLASVSMKGTAMNHARSYWTALLSMILFTISHVLMMPAPVSASTGDVPVVPPEIAVPLGAEYLFFVHAQGMQTYECRDGQWAFRAPKAALLEPDTAQVVGMHYGGIDAGLTPGPWWESLIDGSRIRGAVMASAASSNPDSIPQLLLDVREHQGSGVFTPVTYIQRLNTVGGVGPTGTCGQGAKRLVRYSADYYFYGNP